MVFIGWIDRCNNNIAARLVGVVAAMKNSGFYYMLVTNDKYELPMSPPMTSEEMGKMLGKTRQQIYNIVNTLKKKNRHVNRGIRKYCIVSLRLD